MTSALLAGACTAPGGPGTAESWRPDAGPGPTAVPPDTVVCTMPVRASEDLGARIAVMGGSPSMAAAERLVPTADLFGRFNTLCGQCHVAAANGNRQTSAATFPMNVDASWLAAIESEDPRRAMPPENKAFSSRAPEDPVRKLATWLEAWLAQGRPADGFAIESAPSGGPATDGMGYVYFGMTNLGNCIPSKPLYASSTSFEMEAKDQFFADATELPTDLSDTDLTTFDGEALAANGVIAYVPTYPLWSDGSGKLRHVRVPKGTSIRFDRATQTFDIPPNTRFYKTFFRKVIDASGRESNRKMETRLIVARPDGLDADGKTPKPSALFATYVWSEDEMTATRLDAPYRDGTGFADKTVTYVANEPEFRDVLDGLPTGSAEPTIASARLADALLKNPGVVQHYAIPGSIRCVQCHQGSSSMDFVLGFMPLQLAQRRYSTGGTYELTGDDELGQLQRLIDYGVISGMASPAEVVPLEESEAPRTARTPEELTAQAYMIGNCMHCHNSRGYPSLAKPELASVLDFKPSPGPDGGGIFGFPFERMSPVRYRGAAQDIPFPYITPSLRDYPVANLEGVRMDNGAPLGATDSTGNNVGEVTWAPKYSPELENAKGCTQVTANPLEIAFCGARRVGRSFVAAPWRSLIYRNVDAPFPYFDDYVPFPHMPMNSPGFDCRAPRIMGDWMVSLPAVRKNQRVTEDALPKVSSHRGDGSYDDSAQPYLEVKADEPGYPQAVESAKRRLAEYHSGIRYPYCQDSLGSDIIDPVTPSATTDQRIYRPDPSRYVAGAIPPTSPDDPQRYAQPAIGVPYHSHWFDYDPTDSPPPWRPRRANWENVLVGGTPDDAPPAGGWAGTSAMDKGLARDREMHARAQVVDALSQAELSDTLRAYATTEVPFGLWEEKPECQDKLANMPKVADFSGSARAAWMDWQDPAGKAKPAPANAPVVMMSPGAALYRHICINCHGPNADGKGLQGDALAASSEGDARPASFVDGLFGPRQLPGSNLVRVFGRGTNDLTAATNWGSRYMAWMALGGTLQKIPNDIIHQVEAARIFGQVRPNVYSLQGEAGASANMLNLAKGLCATVLPDQTGPQLKVGVFKRGAEPTDNPPRDGIANSYAPLIAKEAPFIRSNGDWELWMNLCSRWSPPVLRVFELVKNEEAAAGTDTTWDVALTSMFYADGGPVAGDPANATFAVYPTDAPVLDHTRTMRTGITRDNYFPACLQEPVHPTAQQNATIATFQANFKMPMPDCPAAFIDSANLMWHVADYDSDPEVVARQSDNLRQWALRGAISAGMSVFSYLQSADLAHAKPRPNFNECQRLP